MIAKLERTQSNEYQIKDKHKTPTNKKQKKTFCGFSMGSNQYLAGRVYGLCFYFMTGAPEGSTESCFMVKPGIEPVTPGLQGIGVSLTPLRPQTKGGT